MKRNNQIRKYILIGLVWWALFYPELYLVEDGCVVVECENDDKSDENDDLEGQMKDAKIEDIKVTSRLLEWIVARYKEIK